MTTAPIGYVYEAMRAALFAFVLVLLLAGCGARGDASRKAASSPKPEVSAPRSEAGIAVVGATPKQETVLREILAGLAPTIIDQVRISRPRPPWTPYQPHSVVVSVRYLSSPEKERGEWEAALLASAFATRSRLAYLQPVTGYETRTGGFALDGPEEPDPDTREPIDRADLLETIAAAAQSSDAKIHDLRVVKPMNPAASLTLIVDRPAFYLKHRLEKLIQSMPSSSARRYDGLYIRIVDHENRFVWISAQTYGESVSGGTIGARKDLQGCYPNPMYGSADGRKPPPCPVD